MIDPSQVAAIIVTRGNVSLHEIVASYFGNGFGAVSVWNNAIEEDLSVYGRYAAIERVRQPVILVQDDDVVLPAETIRALLDAYEPGVVTANMPQEFRRPWYTDHCLVGFGAIFDRDLPAKAFERIGLYDDRSPFPEDTDWFNYRQEKNGVTIEMSGAGFFHRTCDVVFTTLTPRKLLDVPVQILDYARGNERMFAQPGFHEEREQMLALALSVRDGAPA